MSQGDYYFVAEEEPTCEEIWAEEFDQKNLKLMAWLNEFMESDEFADHFRRKRRRKNKKTQTIEEEEEIVTTEEQPQEAEIRGVDDMHGLHEKLKASLRRKNVAVTIANQQLGINVIKEKILEARWQSSLRRGKKEDADRSEREHALRMLKEEYGIDLPWLGVKSRLVERVLCVRKKRNEAADRRRRNTTAMVEKLLREMKLEKALKEYQPKPWNYARGKGRFVEGLEVIGSRMTLHERSVHDEADSEEEEEDEDIDWEDKVDLKKPKKKKGGKGKEKKAGKDKKKGDKTDKKDKAKESKKEKAKKEKKAKKGKDDKKKKKGEMEIKVDIPVPPMTNTREKIKGEEWEMKKLLSDFAKLQEYLIDQRDYELEQMMEDRMLYDADFEIEATPSKIIFKNFVNGNTYKMRVQLKNTSRSAKNLRFDKIIWNADIDDDLLLEVEPIGIQKLITGLAFSFQLRFNPETLQKSTEAKIIFLTYKPRTEAYHQYTLYVVCTPFCAEITVTPTIISFEEVPIWRAKNMSQKRQNYKILKIKNSGSKECRIVITKVFNPITIEHEWRNLISIMSIEDSNSQPITSSDLGPEDVCEDRFPRNLVEECVENVFNNFRFDRMIFNVAGNSERHLKVWLRNVHDTGFCVETYSLSVYERYPDEKLYCIGTQDLVVNAELTGQFLVLIPDLVDFEVCVYDSVYQLSFQVFNPTNLPHNVRVKFPRSLTQYFTCATSDMTVQPGQCHKVHVKFSPRSDFIENNRKYHDGENDLFEFPIYVAVYTRNFEDTPPMIIDAFVALTDPMGLVLMPPDDDQHVTNIENEYQLDMGSCNTNESVYADIKLQNTSLVPQHYAFLDLPPCLTVHGNFGFGFLQPMEVRHIRLHFQPTKEDLSMCNDEFEANTVNFSITANTIKKLGSMKKQMNLKSLNSKLKTMASYITKPRNENSALQQDIEAMVSLLKTNTTILFPDAVNASSSGVVLSDSPMGNDGDAMARIAMSSSDVDEKILDLIEYDDSPEKRVVAHTVSSEINTEEISDEGTPSDRTNIKNPSNRLWLKATIVHTRCEFSQQFVYFPETPCGSYSVMSVQLRNVRPLGRGWVHFEIAGNSDEILIEPNVGELKSGQKVKLYLVARPETPQHVIENKAVAMKVAEAIDKKRQELEEKIQQLEEKRLELEEKRQRDTSGKEKADKKGKAEHPGKKHRRKSPKEEVGAGEGGPKSSSLMLIDEGDIAYGYFDYYPAEMCVWRSLEPYFIDAEFCCTLTYFSDKRNELNTEKIYLRAKCRVVQPNFIHDLHLQEIDFGKVAIGASSTMCITLQNIQRHSIKPRINPLNPAGCFSTVELAQVSLSPEFLLKIPITYTPQSDTKDIEFFEIVSEQTTYPLILKGEGAFPLITFTPTFTVCRLEGNNADFSFEVTNFSECPVDISFIKLCELEGSIYDKPTESRDASPSKPEKTKDKSPKSGKSKGKASKLGKSKDKASKDKGSKSGKSKGSKTKEEKKRPKHSTELMADEIYSLEESFAPTNPEHESMFSIWANSEEDDTFTMPEATKWTFKVKFGHPVAQEHRGKGKGKKKEKKKKGGKKEVNSSYFVAKFAVTLGKREILKDFIVIGCLK